MCSSRASSPGASRLRASARLLFICCALGLSSAGASNTNGDAWGVRSNGRTLESLSEINTGKPPGNALDAKPLLLRQRGDVSIELRADAPTTAWLRQADKTLAPELEKGLDWLQHLRPRRHPPATLILTLVAPQRHLALRRLHDSSDRTVVDLAVAIVPGASRSAPVAKALAIGLHEMSHAFSSGGSTGQPISRRDDEYRSSMVESCYLVDTMRVGDVLHLVPRQGASGDEYFVTAHSRDASRDVVTALVRAAGSDTVRWNDDVALLGLKLACGIALARR